MSRPTHPESDQILKYHRQCCQARFRGEQWDPEFTYEQWWEIWEPEWHRRGRQADDLIMVRIDIHQPWSRKNVELMVRRDWLREINLGKRNWRGRI